MKYKNIPSALHNFGHSFISLMNYVDDTYVVDLLPHVLRELPSHEMRIAFPAGVIEPERDYPAALTKSVGYYAAGFEEHLRRHNVEPMAVRSAALILVGTLPGVQAYVIAQDDRGRSYSIDVAA